MGRRSSSRFVASGRKRPRGITVKTVLAQKWRPPFFLLSGAKKSTDVTAAKLMACVEKTWLHARKMALLPPGKAPFSAIFPRRRYRLSCGSGVPA